MFNIFDLFELDRPIKIIDVGAMSLGDGTDVYNELIRLGVADIIGFEPVAEECEKLNRAAKSYARYYPYFVGDGLKRTFHLCNYPMTSSLYEPNTPLLNIFHNIENLSRVVRTEQVQTTRLDDLPNMDNIDFIKVDVQGAELDVLRGAENILKESLVIHSEVEFVHLYKNQPLFADIDTYLRERGFVFHRFHGLNGRMFKPLFDKQNINKWISQPLWSDAVYVRDFTQLHTLTDVQILRLAAIMHTVYQSFDLCAYLLTFRDSRAKDSIAADYISKMIGQN